MTPGLLAHAYTESLKIMSVTELIYTAISIRMTVPNKPLEGTSSTSS